MFYFRYQSISGPSALNFQGDEFNHYLQTAEAREPEMAKRITTEVVKYFFGLFSDLDINRLVDTSSLFEYLSSLKTEKDLAPSTVCDKLRHIELAVEYVQCKHSKDIDNLHQNLKRL